MQSKVLVRHPSRPVAVERARLLRQRARAQGGLAAARAWRRGRSAELIRRSPPAARRAPAVLLRPEGAIPGQREVGAATVQAGRLQDVRHLEEGEAVEPDVHLEAVADRLAPAPRRSVVGSPREAAARRWTMRVAATLAGLERVAVRSTERVEARSAKAARPVGLRRAVAAAWARRLTAAETAPEWQAGQADR